MSRRLDRPLPIPQIRALVAEAEHLRRSGKPAEAEALYARALAVDPRDAASLYATALIAQATGRLDEAVDYLLRAITVDEANPDHHASLGDVMRARGETANAAIAYRRALALRPDNADLTVALAGVLSTQGRLGEAIERLEAIRRLDPTLAPVHSHIAHALLRQGRIEEAISAFERTLRLDPREASAHSGLLFALVYSERPPAEVTERHRRWGAAQASAARTAAPHANDRDPDRRLRVGYVSGDFKDHAVAAFLHPLMAHHDKAAVEVCCYSQFARADAATERFRALADRWLDTAGLSDAGLAEAIRADGIDILVDLAGHTSGHRLAAFARRPAPIQVTWLGYPATTGLSAIDYRIVDAITDPPGEADALAVETLVRLEGGFLCYEPRIDAPEPAPPPSLAAGHVTFGSLNIQTKLSEAAIAAYARVLHAVSGSKLLLKGGYRVDPAVGERALAGFAAHGIAPERIDLRGWTETTAEHLAVYGEIDIGLDPMPYNGTTTTCEALWQGVPVVTLAGQAHAGRVGASLLTRVGLEDLIAGDLDAYVRIARDLGADPARLSALRESLRPRMAASSLCDAPAFARKMEAAYRAMWRRWVGTPA